MATKKKSSEETIYDQSSKATRTAVTLAESGKMLVRWDEAVFEESSQGRLKYFSTPVMEGSVLPEWKLFVNEVKDLGGRHTHQGGGVVIYVLEGEGYSICNGVRIDWEPEDLILLPIKPGGVVHQHFNKNPDKYCRWIAFRFEPFHVLMGDRVVQNEARPGWEIPSWSKEQLVSKWTEKESAEAGSPQAAAKQGKATLYDDLLRLRDEQRIEIEGYTNLVKGKKLVWETNPQGKMKWYLHPSLKDRIQTFLFYIQELPPGSKSGKQQHQGGKAIFVLEGKGHSQVGSRTVQWGKYDYLGLPRVRDGIVYQHFNDSKTEPARFIVAEPYLYSVLGVDMGAGFEQLENAPEYKK